MFLNALKLLLPEKLIQTNAPTTAQIYINDQPAENRYVVHILHYIPERRFESVDTIEDVIPLYQVSLSVKMENEPSSVSLQPSNTKLEFTYENGYMNVVVPKVNGHEMVVINYSVDDATRNLV